MHGCVRRNESLISRQQLHISIRRLRREGGEQPRQELYESSRLTLVEKVEGRASIHLPIPEESLLTPAQIVRFLVFMKLFRSTVLTASSCATLPTLQTCLSFTVPYNHVRHLPTNNSEAGIGSHYSTPRKPSSFSRTIGYISCCTIKYVSLYLLMCQTAYSCTSYGLVPIKMLSMHP